MSKINGVESQKVTVGSGSPVRRTSEARVEKTGSEATAAADSTDLHITGTARVLASLEQAVRDRPAVDELRVASVQDALRAGAYSIDPQRIADRLLHLELDLSGAMTPVRAK